MEFGVYLKKVRKAKGLSGRELAKRSNISQAYLSQLERGENNKPSPEIIKKLAIGLGEPTTELMVAARYWEEDDLLEPLEETIKYLTEKQNADKLKNSKIDLNSILEKTNLFYKDHSISDKEKQLIKSYLDALLSNGNN